MKGRTPPALVPKETARRAALEALDVPAMRAWAVRYAVGLLGDDRVVLISMHEARAIDPVTPGYLRRESVRWLREHYPESAALTRHPEEFKGPTYERTRQ